ncbi:Glycoside hydrolase family 17 [Lasiodiplodia theobromae]|uniref:glucan 1,3-beta-glucosidase n=2 Tax=Lasiodiplodia TaxID=66739 RepID=A0A5N5DB06_9PEZI|nr:Glucanbeta-glucosidase [Lasiodiplodia theobromae]KAB2575023.1 Glucan 1,3-beta-glucosidase [Lasiodiplodia theobromae]KAF4534231.1 Glucanbeta-glucosidase [Lasiodiplodia theobromae]KAF9640205.1 Glycoside hydrolase family 17 [Lasiodiplodia theobromae]KAK0659996.1 Glucan 1 [Lasiodiplodia hormozganensis]
MRLSTLATTSLALAPAVVSASGTLGFSLGTKLPDGTCKFQADYEKDFDAISTASGSKLVRGYSVSDCNFAKEILPAAKSKGFKVVLAVWPDVDESLQADKKALKTYATDEYADQIYAVTIGSETLYRGNFTGEELLEKINDVRTVLPKGTKVGTADSWNKWADGTGDAVVKGGVDLILANAFAYWQGADIKNASKVYFDDMSQAIAHIQEVAGGPDKAPEIWNGETGWPTDGGSDYEAAKAGTDNAKTYYHESVCGALKWGLNAFYFEAFDEPWKPVSVGDNGEEKDETKWGAMTSDRKSKFDLKCT